MNGLTEQISGLMAVVLGLVSAYFMLRILVLIFVGQIDLAAGRPGALADLAEQAVYLLVTLALAANAGAIGRAFGALAQANQADLLSGDITRLSSILAPAAGLALGLAANLALAFTLMAVTFIAVRGQIANLTASSHGVAASIVQVLTALAVFGLGLMVLAAGRAILSSLAGG